jgi:hypothetical protein
MIKEINRFKEYIKLNEENLALNAPIYNLIDERPEGFETSCNIYIYIFFIVRHLFQFTI